MGKTLDDLYSAEMPSDTGVSQSVEVAQKPEAEAVAPKAEATQQPDAARQGEPPSPQENPDDKVPRAALTDERKKRQSVEATNKELQRRLDEIEKRLAAPEDRRPTDPLVDPEGFMKEIEVARFEDRLELTSQFLKSQVGDEKYEAAEQAVLQVASSNPGFAQRFAEEVARNKNPGKYTYEVGTAIIQQMEANDPVKQRATLREEIKAELMAEFGLTPSQASQVAAQGQQPTAVKPSIPTSLAGLQSAGPRNPGVRPVKRRSLDELYNR